MLQHPEVTPVQVGSVVFGGRSLVLIAGPCAVESADQMRALHAPLLAAGVHILRGGVFKSRTTPGSFQGLGEKGLQLLVECATHLGIPSCTEVSTLAQLERAVERVDMIQIGARSMHNTQLLRAVGRTRKPVLLKRGFGATIDEWISAAAYIQEEGNGRIGLCELRIRTFEPRTRFTLDLAAVPIAQAVTGCPVIVDPSHAAGDRRWVSQLCCAALGAGADGIILEVHPNPVEALSDGAQSLTPEQLLQLRAGRRLVIPPGERSKDRKRVG